MRTLVALAFILFFTLGGFATWRLTRPLGWETATPTPPTIDERAPASVTEDRAVDTVAVQERARIEYERRRLAQLQEELAAVTDLRPTPTPTAAQERVEEVANRMQEVQAEINRLYGVAETIDDNAATYADQDRIRQSEAAVDLQTQIFNVKTALDAAQTRYQQLTHAPPASDLAARLQIAADEVTSLRARQRELEYQVQVLNAQSGNASLAARVQARAEKAALLDEVTDLKTQLTDLQADLSYWRRQAEIPSESEVLRAERMRELNAAIIAQQKRVDDLE